MKDFINASENKPNQENPCNKLLISGSSSGKSLIKNKIKEIAQSIDKSKLQLIEFNILNAFEQMDETFFKYWFHDINEIVIKERKTVVVIIDHIDFFTKYLEDSSNDFPEVKKKILNCMKMLFEDLNQIRNNPYIYLVGITNDEISQFDNIFRETFANDIIHLDSINQALLQRNFSNYNEKPKNIPVNIILDPLNNLSVIQDDNIHFENFPNKLERYVKTDLEGITGWIPYQIYEIIENIQNSNSDKGICIQGFGNALCNKFLLYGPQGNGKTALIKIIAHATDSHLIEINGTDLFTGFVNQAAEKLVKYFEDAKDYVLNHKYKKVIIFIDEVDSFVQSSSNQSPSNTYHNDAAARLSMLLNEFKGIERVYIFFATNNYKKINNTFTSRTFAINIPNPTKIMKKEAVNYYMNFHGLSLSTYDIDKIINMDLSIRDIQDIFSKSIQTTQAQVRRCNSQLKNLTLSEIVESNLCTIDRELIKRKKENDKEDVSDQLQIEHLKSAKIANDPETVKKNKEALTLSIANQKASLKATYIQTGALYEGAKGTAGGIILGGGIGLAYGYKTGKEIGGQPAAFVGAGLGATVGGAAGAFNGCRNGIEKYYKYSKNSKLEQQVITEAVVKKENMKIKSSI